MHQDRHILLLGYTAAGVFGAVAAGLGAWAATAGGWVWGLLLLWVAGGAVWLASQARAWLQHVTRLVKLSLELEGNGHPVPAPASIQSLQLGEAALARALQRQRDVLARQSRDWEMLRGGVEREAGTGVLVRPAFLGRLASILLREDAPAYGVLVLLRLQDLQDANQRLGHRDVDRALADLGARLLNLVDAADPSRAGVSEPAFAGRLNGTDFALCFPGAQGAAAVGDQVLASLEASVMPAWSSVFTHPPALASAAFQQGASLSVLLAVADQALAQAELSPARHVAVAEDDEHTHFGGESEWRQLILAAVRAGLLELAQHPVRDGQGRLLQYACPVRLRLGGASRAEPAARWLPLAVRTGTLAEVELAAMRMALDAALADGRLRALHVGLASLNAPGFQEQVRAMLQDMPLGARLIALDLPEAALLQAPDRVRAFVTMVRGCGAHWGLTHAGGEPGLLERLQAWKPDHVKVNASVWQAAEVGEQGRDMVRGLTAAIHGLGILAHAEGVADVAQAERTLALGFDGVTGPGVR